MTERGANAAIKTTNDPLDGVDWNCQWDPDAAAHLFVAVRELCGVPPAVPELSNNVATALQEAREMLERAGWYEAVETENSADSAGAWAAPSWRDAAAEYLQALGNRASAVTHTPEELAKLRWLLADEVSLQRAHAEIAAHHTKGRAANSTVDALVFSLRSGVSAIADRDVRRRLSELSDDQFIEVGGRLRRLKPEIAIAWTADEVDTLLQLREKLR
jgi:hypothetical protein